MSASVNKLKFYNLLCSLSEKAGLEAPVEDFKFHPSRKWKFDYCWLPEPSGDTVSCRCCGSELMCPACESPPLAPPVRLAVEIQGGTYMQGKHSRGAGQKNDFEKINEAQRLGWRVILLDSSHIGSGPKRKKAAEFLMSLLRNK